MGFKFTDASRYPYTPGGFFLGIDEHGREVGISTERHLITVAGAGSGKGATLIIPNLKRWRGSCVVIDPKGENATITAGDREGIGQLVGVVDPYHNAKGRAAALRCSINPLAAIDPASRTIRADLEALGDGLIRRHDPRHAQWDDTAGATMAGLADFVLAVCPPEQRTLPSVRGLLLLPEGDLKKIAGEMLNTATAAGLARQAGALLQNKFSNPEGVPAQAFARAVQETGWIDDPAFADALGGGDLPAFDLATLKAGTGSLFLCIPPGYLDTRGGFLRLFVRMGLMTMMSDLAGHGGGGRCLFVLDEFHSLGKLDIVAKAAGLMRGYGVQLWPFLQDMGQLESLYGGEEMHTFFANADARIFFGNSDKPTLRDISDMLGNLQPDEIMTAPPQRKMGWNSQDPLFGDLLTHLDRKAAVKYDNDRAQYDHAMRQAGRPRLTPEEVAELVGKKDGDKVARSAIVFAKGGDVLNVRLQPYFPPGGVSSSAPAAGDFIARERKAFGGINPAVAYGGMLILGLVFYHNNTGGLSFGIGLALTIYGGFGLAVTAFYAARPRLAQIPRPSLKQSLAYSTLILLGLLLVAATGERDGIGGYAALTLMMLALVGLGWVGISGLRDIFRWIGRR
jgi:hypothetical protein